MSQVNNRPLNMWRSASPVPPRKRADPNNTNGIHGARARNARREHSADADVGVGYEERHAADAVPAGATSPAAAAREHKHAADEAGGRVDPLHIPTCVARAT